MRDSLPSPGFRWLLAFAILTLVVHELHEVAHTTFVRLLCGAYGARGFNAWQLPEGCSTLVPTAMGPLFSYLVMFAGVALLGSAELRRRWLGLGLAIAGNPLARVITAAMGGGDEGVLARALLGGPGTTARVTASVIVGALCLVPLVAAWRALPRAGRARWWSAIVIMPMLTTGLLFIYAGDRLLAAGVLPAPVAGAPMLVHLATLVTLALLAATWRWLVPDAGVAGWPAQNSSIVPTATPAAQE
jgi:hypothetical protein